MIGFVLLLARVVLLTTDITTAQATGKPRTKFGSSGHLSKTPSIKEEQIASGRGIGRLLLVALYLLFSI